jgi:methylenetetrahydrofolate dehydrogenase (NADP+)/methenyltetrahydrofolate cyclohydrolase
LWQSRRTVIAARVIDGKVIAAKVQGEITAGVGAFFTKHGTRPGLGVVLVGDDPASHSYVRGKERACQDAGIFTETLRLTASTSQDELLGVVQQLNQDARFHGVLVQLPLPDHIDEDTIIRSVLPTKDVDGLHPENAGLLFAGTPRFASATPLGVQRMLIEENVETRGANAVIVGRSKLVGLPLAALLLGRGKGANATVTVCHTGTRDLGAHTRQADILVAAAGRPGTISGDMVKPGAVVIDVGVNRVDDPSRKRGYRLVGDVNFDEVSEVASAITPVPGGVGPMTITMLLHNVLLSAHLAAGE